MRKSPAIRDQLQLIPYAPALYEILGITYRGAEHLDVEEEDSE